jgi:hypothetical protein
MLQWNDRLRDTQSLIENKNIKKEEESEEAGTMRELLSIGAALPRSNFGEELVPQLWTKRRDLD